MRISQDLQNVSGMVRSKPVPVRQILVLTQQSEAGEHLSQGAAGDSQVGEPSVCQ